MMRSAGARAPQAQRAAGHHGRGRRNGHGALGRRLVPSVDRTLARWRVGTRRRPGGGGSVVALHPVSRTTRRLGLGKGEKAETHAGQAIEHALTAPDCAVANSVITIARVGDIDHLVATPVRLWVIETKYRRIPRERFPEVLRQIADNTSAVWEWAPAGTPVRGCLVLANAAQSQRKTFDYGKEPIVVHTPASLAHELKAEARKERMIDERVAANVRELGRIPE